MELSCKGACFRCKKTGYMSYKCPNNPNYFIINLNCNTRWKANIACIKELYGNAQFNSEKLDNVLYNLGNT